MQLNTVKTCSFWIESNIFLCFKQQFCGVLGHTFMEFLKGSGDYCQAQHDLYADKWTAEIHYCSTKKPPKDWLTWTQKCWIEIHRAFLYKSSDLDGVNLSALPFYCLSITGLKNCCFLLRGSFIHYSQFHTQKHWEFQVVYIEGDSVSSHHFCIQFFKLFHIPIELTKLTPSSCRSYIHMRFLITHNPTNATLNKFIAELNKFHYSKSMWSNLWHYSLWRKKASVFSVGLLMMAHHHLTRLLMIGHVLWKLSFVKTVVVVLLFIVLWALAELQSP